MALIFCDHPAEHGVHLRAASPIGSSFATARHQRHTAKDHWGRATGLATASPFAAAAQGRQRSADASHAVASFRVGAVFVDGRLVERSGRAVA